MIERISYGSLAKDTDKEVYGFRRVTRTS